MPPSHPTPSPPLPTANRPKPACHASSSVFALSRQRPTCVGPLPCGKARKRKAHRGQAPMYNLYRSKAPIQIVHRGRAPMGLSLPCGKARKRAKEGWPLPARCGNRRARVIGEPGPVCLWQRRRGGGMCYRQRGAWWRAACCLGGSLSLLWIRRPGEGEFRSLR